MGLEDKIKEIEFELSRTQKNKATEHHFGMMKAKLAKLRSQLFEAGSKTGKAGEGFDVGRYGNARIAMIGFPSVGKSTLLNRLTNTQSQVSALEFTTLTCIPGIIQYNDTKLQLLDLPGIIEGAADGRGRGKQVIAVARSSDLVLMVLEAQKGEEQKRKLTKEMEKMGIRLNKNPPKIDLTINKTGGVKFNATVPTTFLNEKTVRSILNEYKIHNCDVLCRDDATIDDMIDVIEGNRKYIKCIYVYNKIDTISLEDCDELAHRPNSVLISCEMKLNLDYLMLRSWEELALFRIYTKKRNSAPDFADPIILTAGRNGCTVRSCCQQIHKDLVKEFKYAVVWGRSCKFNPQRVGLNHVLADEDVIQIYKITKKK